MQLLLMKYEMGMIGESWRKVRCADPTYVGEGQEEERLIRHGLTYKDIEKIGTHNSLKLFRFKMLNYSLSL